MIVPNETAISAAAKALEDAKMMPVWVDQDGYILPKVVHTTDYRRVLGDLLAAAIPHLTDAGQPLDPTANDREPEPGPTDYEVWRDALTLAQAEMGSWTVDGDMLARALWWRDQLKRPIVDARDAEHQLRPLVGRGVGLGARWPVRFGGSAPLADD